LGVVTSYVLAEVGYILHETTACDTRALGTRRRPVRPMHPTLSPALVRPMAARGPVAIMFCLKSLKAGAEVERSSLEQFGGLELKTARSTTVPSSSIYSTTSVAVGYHLRRHRRRCLHLHLGSRVCRIYAHLAHRHVCEPQKRISAA
jgi:hypothetical protein